MFVGNYDYSKFEKFGVTELDFKFDIKRAWSCGNANFENCNGGVFVTLKNYGLSVGCSTEKSQFKNKNKALDLMYILLEEEFKDVRTSKKEVIKMDLLDCLERLSEDDRNTFYNLLEQMELDENKIKIID